MLDPTAVGERRRRVHRRPQPHIPRMLASCACLTRVIWHARIGRREPRAVEAGEEFRGITRRPTGRAHREPDDGAERVRIVGRRTLRRDRHQVR
jgi:hypothetical protein